MNISEKDGLRLLHLGSPAVQSAMRIKAPFDLALEYTRAMLAFLLFRPDAQEVALIGLGGGSIAKFIHRHIPQIHLTAVEINPAVVAAARAYFLLPEDDARLEVRLADGAEYVRQCDGVLDALLVDAYDAVRIVEALATSEFYAACRRALRPGGVAVFNLWGKDRRYPDYYARLEAAFAGHLLQLPTVGRSHSIVFAFKPPLTTLTPLVRARAGALERELGVEFMDFVERLNNNRLAADWSDSRPVESGLDHPRSQCLCKSGRGWENANKLSNHRGRP